MTAGVAIPTMLNGFGVRALANNPLASLAGALTTDTDHVLVIIQLSGGNDGLNTLVPLDHYDRLQQGRPHVILPQSSLLPLDGNDTLAWHPALSGFRDLYDAGNLHVVQNVGYPEQNYSHFRSTDIWMSGSDHDQYLPTGWLGRYLAYEYPNFPNGYPNTDMPHPLAIEIGYALSQNLMGPQTNMGFVIANADSFYQLVSGVQSPAPNTPAGEQLAYIRLVAQQSRTYAQAIIDASNAVSAQQSYPDTELAAKLKIVARLIAGGLKTRVYVVTIDGFDTHDSQVEASDHTLGEHAELLATVGNAVRAFTQDLDYLGVADRVVGMTTSEFGRRIASNASLGTDHGEAAPLFLFGKAVAGGVTGDNPDIPAFPTADDPLPLQFDFRQVYASVLRDWFCVEPTDVPAIMLHDFPYLDNLFPASLPCVSTSVHTAHQTAGHNLLRLTPNPFATETTILYETGGGQTSVHVLDASGRLVATPVNTRQPKGEYQTPWNAAALAPGTYFFRLVNGARHQTKMAVKM